jgi:hypothetical protein
MNVLGVPGAGSRLRSWQPALDIEFVKTLPNLYHLGSKTRLSPQVFIENTSGRFVFAAAEKGRCFGNVPSLSGIQQSSSQS